MQICNVLLDILWICDHRPCSIERFWFDVELSQCTVQENLAAYVSLYMDCYTLDEHATWEQF